MKKKEDNYYGIRFNNDIPKIDKINNFNKEVEIKFIGKAYLVKRKDDKIEKIELKNYHKLEKEGTYEVEYSTSSGLTVKRKIFVVNQPFVKNEKANEAISAFNFFKTVDEITESMTLDTDLKTWANAQGWKLSNEEEAIEIFVDYDFDPETVKEGVYKVTFSTPGRELKVHTTDHVEEGQVVGLTFYPVDIHVMEKMVF